MSRGPDQRDYSVYFVKKGEQQERLRFLKEKCRSLFGADVYYDQDGNISYFAWHGLPKEGFLPAKFIKVSREHPQAVIYAPHSRYDRFKELRVRHVRKDDGSVETAIRSIDHILEGEKGRETAQAETVGHRAHELLDLFSTSFIEITEEELKEARGKTYAILAKVGLDPTTVEQEEKRKMTGWLIKGSFGKDSLGRRNRLITTMALSAAYRQAIERQKGIGTIVGKYVRIREALIFEREFSWAIFADVLDRLRPEALPAHRLFKFPERSFSQSDSGIVVGMINTMRFQLSQPHVKCYRTVGREAASILSKAVGLLGENNRREIVDQQLFTNVRGFLLEELERHRDIYPAETN